VRSVGPETADSYGFLDLVVDHALLRGAHVGDLLAVAGVQAAHLTGSHGPQFSPVGVEHLQERES
jgi:hypothetical protein